MSCNEYERRPRPVAQATGASECWRAAVVAQRGGLLDHRDFAELAGEVAATLRTLEELSGLLCRQVDAYRAAGCTDPGLFALVAPLLRRSGPLIDTEGRQPADRLMQAARHLVELRGHVRAAARASDEIRSELSHLDVAATGEPGRQGRREPEEADREYWPTRAGLAVLAAQPPDAEASPGPPQGGSS
jgi:hypothetical protein